MKTWLVTVLIFSVSGFAHGQPIALTLSTFLDLVERNSLALESARIEQGFTETDVTVTRALTRPAIGAQASLTRSLLETEQNIPGMGSITIDPFNELSGGVSLQQLIFDLRSFRALEASRRADDLTASVFEARRQAVLTGAKKLFYQAILLEEVVAVRRASEELARDAYDDVRRRADAGVASRLDVLRAELAWRTTVPEVTQAERNSAVARANLRAFAGIEPGAELHLTGSLNDVPPRPVAVSLSDALDGRPDVQALRGARTLRELGIAAQRAEFYPSLSGSVTWGWSATDEGFAFSDPTQTLRAGLQLQIPIYSGGARMGRLNRARLELDSAQVELDQAINDIRTELERIELSLTEAEARMESARSTVATAELAFEMTQLSVDAGISTQLELKDARVSLVSAQLSLYAASFDFLSAYFDRQAAVGQGADPLR